MKRIEVGEGQVQVVYRIDPPLFDILIYPPDGRVKIVGGVISPLLANIALHGIEDLFHEWSLVGGKQFLCETVGTFNLLRVCERCHRIVEGERVPDGNGRYHSKLTLAHVLYCKREQDPDEYAPNRLTMLWRHRERKEGFDPLPEPETLPEVFLAERRQRF